MIIYRYLSQQLFLTTVTVTSVLVFILVGGRFLKYMQEAAEGRIAGEVLLSIMLFRLPNFLEMILPLALFLGILLAYGRLYTDNEMSILQTAGIGHAKLIALTGLPVVCMMGVVGGLSLWLSPLGLYHSERILAEQKNHSALNTLSPGRFHGARHQNYVIYVEEQNATTGELRHVYMVQHLADSVVVVAADQGQLVFDPQQSLQLLQLEQGHRYEGAIGQANFTRMDYTAYQMKLDNTPPLVEVDEVKTLPTRALSQQSGPEASAEWQWRWSLPFLVPIIACIAIPLSRVNPRQGRYVQILPSILIYLAYLSVLSGAKNGVESGLIPEKVGLWWVHALFALVAGVFLSSERLRLRGRFWVARSSLSFSKR